ncbi:MAG: hypothetical protein LZF61_06635 [Nitrosomonas sp.]|nr:MAG: hypothetical protein LZF61_06635 [Nitrosomonas sp.]
MTKQSPDHWIDDVEKAIQSFASNYRITYARKERELSASFEIGCLHALTDFYETNCSLQPMNLKNGTYRYLTTPNGNPNNFSHVEATVGNEVFEIRQQVRIRSYLNPDIAFTPDMVVMHKGANIMSHHDPDYASGKRKFFCVNSADVIAAHECKSTNPFPELLVSFVGMLIAAHAWLTSPTDRSLITVNGNHLAPTLFVGGTASGIHQRMVRAMEASMPINIVLGLHRGTWNLLDPAMKRNRITTR